MSCRVTRSKLSRCLLPGIFLLVAACATQQPQSDLDRTRSWETHKQEIYPLQLWRLAGRIAVRYEGEAWSASLYWQQDNENYNLRLVAPLAGGSVEITGNADTVSLKTSEEESYTGRDVDLLMQEQLGWSVPVSAMAYWIKGLPEPGVMIERIDLNDNGSLAELAQSEWDIIYQAYTRAGGHQLPARLMLSRDDLTLRLSINRWYTSNDQ